MKIFFDVDGVLIEGWHSNPDLRKPWSRDLEADLGVSPVAFSAALFAPDPSGQESGMAKCTTGKADLKEILAGILPSLGFTGAVDDFLNYWLVKDANISRSLMDLVKYLGQRGDSKLHIVTGQEHYRASYLWDDLGFSNHFVAMHYSADIGYAKEDVRFYEAVNHRLGLSFNEAPLFFDDSPSALSAAQAGGWDSAQFNTIQDVYDHPRLADLLKGYVPVG